MTIEIFNRFLSDLQSYFGAKPFADSIKAQYFKACEPVNNSKAKELFERILNDAKYFPKIPELAGYISATLGQTQKNYTPIINTTRCYLCMDKGLIPYTRKIRNINYDFLARCPKCEIGKSFVNSPTIAYDKIFGEEATELLEKNNRRKYGCITASEAKETVARNYGEGIINAFERGIGDAEF